MSVRDLVGGADRAAIGASTLDLMAELFPICRSITGAGLRETLARIGKVLPLELTEVPTGTQVFDWTIPREWNVRDAWVADASGRRVVDFQASNLHVVNYSVPVRGPHVARRARPAPAHPGRPPHVGPVPDVVLRRQLGLLPQRGGPRRPRPTANTRSSSTARSRTAA